VLHSGRPGPYLQTLDLAGEACQEKHASLLQTFLNYGHKSFITLTPGPRLIGYARIVKNIERTESMNRRNFNKENKSVFVEKKMFFVFGGEERKALKCFSF